MAHLWNRKTRANLIGLNSISPSFNACTFEVEFPCVDKPVSFPGGRPPQRKEEDARRSFADREGALSSHLINNEVEQLRPLQLALMYDPLVYLTSDDKTILWKYREMLLSLPKAMVKEMSAVSWLMPFGVYEARCL